MQHLAIAPILLPMLTAVLMLLPPLHGSVLWQRIVGSAALLLTFVCALLLLGESLEVTQVYVLGSWQPPFGIILAADPLAALLVGLTSFLALVTLLSSFAGHDQGGMYFHPLFLFQVTGINGAFLTGDIFNLFVFFEILLIASYALLLHGGGKEKTQAGFHYVALNLLGSAFFLFALGLLYGTLGTLNMADMAAKAAELTGEEALLAKAGVLLLLLVFGLKSAILPLHFWLAKTYAAAVAPIAALFTIMTKVGVYSFFRVHVQVFGEQAGELANAVNPWLWPLALLTIGIGSIGVLSSRHLRDLTNWLVIVSVGTLIYSVALNHPKATAAGLYYLLHSTLVTAALYLLADLIGSQRGQAGDRFVSARPLRHPTLFSGLFFFAAVAVVGLPPFSGFIGKVAILQAVPSGAAQLWIWPILLLSGLAGLIGLSRAGTIMFWRVRGNRPTEDPVSFWQVGAIAVLLLVSPLMVVFANDVLQITSEAAARLHSPMEITMSELKVISRNE